MKTTAVLFDMDGVIVDSLPTHAQAARSVLRQYGLTLSKEEYYDQFAGVSDEAGFAAYLKRVGADIDLPTVLAQKAAEYRRLCEGNLVPFPGAVELVESLAGQGIALGLVTGALRSEAELTLTSFGIRQYFRALVAAEDTSHSKPHPGGYLKGLAALGKSSDRCLVIEDAPEGVEAATRAGMRSVAVTHTHPASELSAATRVVDSLAGLTLD